MTYEIIFITCIIELRKWALVDWNLWVNKWNEQRKEACEEESQKTNKFEEREIEKEKELRGT